MNSCDFIIDNNDIFGETITIQASKIDACIKYINDNELESVYIWDWKYDGDDVDFLTECQSVKRVNINSRKIKRISALSQLRNLEELILETADSIDLHFFSNLRSLSADCSRISGVEELVSLERLYLWNYNNQKQFSEMKNLNKLKYLQLNSPEIVNLKEIGIITQLQCLEIAYGKKLYDISAIKELKETLTELRIDNCKKIDTYAHIKYLSELRSLALCNDNDIESISFIRDLCKLEQFIFVGTNILDGNLHLCERLKHVDFTNKKHYSHKTKDFTKVLLR